MGSGWGARGGSGHGALAGASAAMAERRPAGSGERDWRLGDPEAGATLLSISTATGAPQWGVGELGFWLLTAGSWALGPDGAARPRRGTNPSLSLERQRPGAPALLLEPTSAVSTHCSPQDLVLRCSSLWARPRPGGWLLLRRGHGEGERARPRRGLRGARAALLCAWMCASNKPTFWFTCTFCSSRCRIRSFLVASSGPGGERDPALPTCCPSPLGRPAQLGLPTLLRLLLPLPLWNRRRPLRQLPGLPGSSGDRGSAGGKRKEVPLPGLNTLPGLSTTLPGDGGASLPLGRGPPPLFAWLALFMMTRLLRA